MILRSSEIDTLILFGIATSGVVLSTLLDSCDRDYRLLIVKDCCADLDNTLHSCLIEKLFPARGLGGDLGRGDRGTSSSRRLTERGVRSIDGD
jgi:nicotinamidase-related amidase